MRDARLFRRLRRDPAAIGEQFEPSLDLIVVGQARPLLASDVSRREAVLKIALADASKDQFGNKPSRLRLRRQRRASRAFRDISPRLERVRAPLRYAPAQRLARACRARRRCPLRSAADDSVFDATTPCDASHQRNATPARGVAWRGVAGVARQLPHHHPPIGAWGCGVARKD